MGDPYLQLPLRETVCAKQASKETEHECASQRGSEKTVAGSRACVRLLCVAETIVLVRSVGQWAKKTLSTYRIIHIHLASDQSRPVQGCAITRLLFLALPQCRQSAGTPKLDTCTE